MSLKKIITLISIIYTYNFTFGQFDEENNQNIKFSNDKAELTIKICNDNQQPIPNIAFWLIKNNSKQKINGLTDKNGKAVISVDKGCNYILNFSDKENYAEINIPARGVDFITKKIIYNTPQSNYLSTKKLNIDTINQVIPANQNSSEDALVKIIVKDSHDKIVPSLILRLYCKTKKTIYVAKTDLKGEARFLVLPGNKYFIEVDECKEYQSFDLPNYAGIKYNLMISYQPKIIFDEFINNDTITQNIPEKAEATSSQILVKVTVYNLSKQLLPNENVYLDIENSTKVYSGITNENGIVKFLLPQGAKYILNFKYERHIDLLDYTERCNVHETEIEYQYTGSLAIENFYKTAKRDKNGFITEFESRKATPIKIEPGYVKKTKDGFNIKFESKKEISSPTIVDNKIFVNGGFYSPHFYCFDAKNGLFNWGVDLDESGVSSAVADNESVLVTTESCTLYALDSKTGKLRWSKWLSPYLYTTPSISDKKVFVVYGNGLNSYENNNKYVLACFDLLSGKILWQNWVNNEGIASPVICNNKVYLTTVSGKLYQFDENTGILKNSIDINATTPPTIADDKLFIGTIEKNDSSSEIIQQFNTDNLSFIKNFQKLKSFYEKFNFSGYPCIAMNYTGSRPVYYKDNIYNTMNNKLFCTNSLSGNIVWSSDLSNEINDTLKNSITPMPTIVSNKIIVPTNDGKIKIYNSTSGQIIKVYETDQSFWSQAIAYDGWIYCGSENGKLISIDTKDKSITGWNMWSGNNNHNPVIKN